MMTTFQDITKPDYPVEIDIRDDGSVLWINVDGKCVLRICQIPAIILCDKRRKQTKAENARKLLEILKAEVAL